MLRDELSVHMCQRAYTLCRELSHEADPEFPFDETYRQSARATAGNAGGNLPVEEPNGQLLSNR